METRKTLLDQYDELPRIIAQYDAKECSFGVVNDAQNALYSALGEGQLSRGEYEAQCTSLVLVPRDDERIRRSGYTLRWMDMPVGRLDWLETGLARQRLNALEAAGRQVVSLPTQPTAACAACGAVVPTSWLMNASLQSGVCPDCYDAYSN